MAILKPLSPTELTERITLRHKTVTINTFGEQIETRVDGATVWAKVKYVRGSEYFAAQQTMANIDIIFLIRYRRDVSPITEIGFDGRDYDVSAVIPLGKREALEIYASARAE